MTMRLTIKNEDTHRTAVVETVGFNPADPSTAKTTSVGSIAPGDTQEVWIHSSQRVVLTEKQD